MLSTESARDFEERYIARRSVTPPSVALFAVHETAGKAHAAGVSETHHTWRAVVEEGEQARSRRKLGRSKQTAAYFTAGLPPGKQMQDQGGCTYLEMKQSEDERLGIARRLAVRIEQQRERAEANGYNPSQLLLQHRTKGSGADSDRSLSKNVQLQEQEQQGSTAPVADGSGASGQRGAVAGGANTVLDSAREMAQAVSEAFAGALKSFNSFREREAPLPYAPRKLTASRVAHGMSFPPSSLARPDDIAKRDTNDRMHFGGAEHASTSGAIPGTSDSFRQHALLHGSPPKLSIGYRDVYRESPESRDAIASSSTARRVLAARGGLRHKQRLKRHEAAKAEAAPSPTAAGAAGSPAASVDGAAGSTPPQRRVSKESARSSHSAESRTGVRSAAEHHLPSAPLPPPSMQVLDAAGGGYTVVAADFGGAGEAPSRRPAHSARRNRRLSNEKMDATLPAPPLISESGHTRFELKRLEQAWNTQESFKARDERADSADLHRAWDSRPMWKKPIGRTYSAPDNAPEHAIPENLATRRQIRASREPRTKILIEDGFIRIDRPDWAPSQLPEPWC